MEQDRLCIACGARLTGPFHPEVSLTQEPPVEESEQKVLEVTARSWVCPGCGLVHRYVKDRDLDSLLDLAVTEESADVSPGKSYERRIQMLRMLRRVRRM